MIGNKWISSLSIIFLISILFGQDEPENNSKIYWNSLSSSVKIEVPLVDDESLIGGRIQVRSSFDGGKTFQNVGQDESIEKGDTDDIKEILIPRKDFASLDGFTEGGTTQFIAEIWDRAGNSLVGSVSDSMLTIDETIPALTYVSVKSTNQNNAGLAILGDTLTLFFKVSEPIKTPKVEINGDSFDPVGNETSWMVEYGFGDADDGKVTFSISFMDYAKNPGETVTETTDTTSIVIDGTLPELSDIHIYSSNTYGKHLAVKGDTSFLMFNSSESIQDITVLLNSNHADEKNTKENKFTYYHIFTESDSEGVVPFSIDFRDLAGNAGEQVSESSDDSEIIFDMTPPQAFKIQSVGSMVGKGKKIKKKSGKNEPEPPGSFIDFSSTLFIIVISCVGFILLIMIASYWKIFAKAGQSGWKALIPFFNLFIFTKVIQKPVWWIIFLFLFPVGHILGSLQLAKVFGKKILFTVGLIFLPFIFLPMLAFGKAEYTE
jgi:hypothetical protein